MDYFEEVAALYQSLLRERFPDISVCIVPNDLDEPAGCMFSAYGIPVEREKEFSRYLYGEFPSLLHSKGIEFFNTIIHTYGDCL